MALKTRVRLSGIGDYPLQRAGRTILLILSVALGMSSTAIADDNPPLPPVFAEGQVADFFTDVSYDPAVPTPRSVLGFPLGAKPARYDAVIAYLRALADSSPRAELIPMGGASHEGRPLYYLVVGDEENVANRESIREGLGRLAAPAAGDRAGVTDDVVAGSPALAWLEYSIHGDELSGTDAALWTAYHLVAATDPATQHIRDSVLTIIDPCENPDGRERYLGQVYSINGVVPSSDAQSLHHQGTWPWGRTNHYLFDLNRDWLPLVHPETRARVAAINDWNPQVVVDAHEMGSYSSFLMSPPREPINPNVTPTLRRWWDIFAIDHGRTFDRRGWSYYTGDWNEEWYPGYGSSWSLFTGAVGILYEQARVHGSAVKRPDGILLSYPETVAHQVVGSLATLTTAADNRYALLADYARFHRAAVTGVQKGLDGAFILAPGVNAGREREFLGTILAQGLRVERALSTFSVMSQVPGGRTARRSYPAGSYLVPLSQPRGLLAKAILEFDPHLSPEFLQKERREIEKGNGSEFYEVTAWSLSLAYDLDISYATQRLSVNSEPMVALPQQEPGTVSEPSAIFGFLLPIRDDRSMVALARMLEDELVVRSAIEPFSHGGVSYEGGTLLLRRSENPDDLPQRLERAAAVTGVSFRGTNSNYCSTGPDLGSDRFRLLRQPRIGLITGDGTDYTSVGSLWYLFDHRLRIRHSLLDIRSVARLNLSVYNVLVLPDFWGGAGRLKAVLGSAGLKRLKDWVTNGGTLIAIGASAFLCADSTTGLSATRERGAVLAKLDEYEEAWQKERAAYTATVDTSAVWSTGGTSAAKPPSAKLAPPKLDDLKRDDRWALRFQPRGVIARLDCDPEHWLAFGTRGRASAIVYTRNALMAKPPVKAVARVAPKATMRLAGLLWPEARERWEKTAFVTRESRGRGQVILFADEPFFRAHFHGTKRMFLNATLLGPGLGTRQTTPW